MINEKFVFLNISRPQNISFSFFLIEREGQPACLGSHQSSEPYVAPIERRSSARHKLKSWTSFYTTLYRHCDSLGDINRKQVLLYWLDIRAISYFRGIERNTPERDSLKEGRVHSFFIKMIYVTYLLLITHYQHTNT